MKQLTVTAEEFLKRGSDRLPQEPEMVKLRLTGARNALAAIANSRLLLRVSVLDLSFQSLGPSDVVALVASRYVCNLASLDLKRNFIKTEGAAALAASKYLRNLTSIDLACNDIKAKGAAEIGWCNVLSVLSMFDPAACRSARKLTERQAAGSAAA
jgi:hypothetical protein